MGFQAEFGEGRAGVFIDDRLGLAVGKQRQRDGDEAAHQMRVAVAAEMQNRLAGGVDARLADDPHLTDATQHFAGVVMLLGAQRFERAAEFEDVAVAVFPIVEKGEVVTDGGDRSQGGPLGASVAACIAFADAKWLVWNVGLQADELRRARRP